MPKALKIYWIAGPGAHDWAFNPVQMLQARGHQVLVLCPTGSPAAAKAEQKGLPWRAFNFPRRLKNLSAIGRAVGELKHIFQIERPDIVHHYMLPISLWARTAAWLAGIPARVYKPPSLWDLQISLYRFLELSTAWMDSSIVASSKPLEAFYRRSPLTRHKTILSYYGLPLAPFDPRLDGSAIRHELGIGPDEAVVGLIAYLVPPIRRFDPTKGIKGHEVLIQAAQIVVDQDPKVKFLIVGDEPPKPGRGAYRARLQQMVCELGLEEKVVFTGYRSDIPRIMAAVDVVAVPSLSENVGGAVEPLLMEKPVVASNVGGLPDVVIEGETGFLVPPDNPPALAQAIQRVLALSPQERQQMGRRGRALVAELFDIEKTVDQLEALYLQILGRGTRF